LRLAVRAHCRDANAERGRDRYQEHRIVQAGADSVVVVALIRDRAAQADRVPRGVRERSRLGIVAV